ncbi:hypothetical protein [Hoylesella enoeca]|uniref:hypothetical protein n=1 Tax=Hoylesella enoeca TaxID=76123 RepID=UPI002889A99A|nr:hypothetical protein [Hoylesella enoeca]
MNKNQVTIRRVYLAPAIEVIATQPEHALMQASGQHEHIGQGGTGGDAKQNFFFDEEEDDTPQGGSQWERE